MDRQELYSREAHDKYMEYMRKYFEPKQLIINFDNEKEESRTTDNV